MAFRYENNEVQLDPDVAIGVKFPFNGRRIFNSTFTTLDQSSSNLKNLLLTGRGERYELLDFGTALKFLLFEQQTDELKIAIDEEIRESVNRWLPYISIQKVTIDFDSPEDSHITINIVYTVSNIEAEESLTITSMLNGAVSIE